MAQWMSRGEGPFTNEDYPGWKIEPPTESVPFWTVSRNGQWAISFYAIENCKAYVENVSRIKAHYCASNFPEESPRL